MKAYNGNREFIGYLEREGHRFYLTGRPMPEAAEELKKAGGKDEKGFLWAKELMDWLFACDVITVLGIILSVFINVTYYKGVSLVIIQRAFMLVPVALVIRFICVLFTVKGHKSVSLPAVLFVQCVFSFVSWYVGLSADKLSYFLIANFIALEVVFVIRLKRSLFGFFRDEIQSKVNTKKTFIDMMFYLLILFFVMAFAVFFTEGFLHNRNGVINSSKSLLSNILNFILIGLFLYRIIEAVQFRLTARRILERFRFLKAEEY